MEKINKNGMTFHHYSLFKPHHHYHRTLNPNHSSKKKKRE